MQKKKAANMETFMHSHSTEGLGPQGYIIKNWEENGPVWRPP